MILVIIIQMARALAFGNHDQNHPIFAYCSGEFIHMKYKIE